MAATATIFFSMLQRIDSSPLQELYSGPIATRDRRVANINPPPLSTVLYLVEMAIREGRRARDGTEGAGASEGRKCFHQVMPSSLTSLHPPP
jgi:hypothetical protein